MSVRRARDRARSLAATAGVVAVVVAGSGAAAAAPNAAPTAGPISSDDLARSVQDILLSTAVRPIDLNRSIIDLSTEKRSAGSVTVTINSDVLFAFDSADLTPAALARIDAIAAKAAAAHGPVTVDGYTDSVGVASYNQTLSQRRADAVAARLRARAAGLSITATGHGAANPVAPNRTPDGKDNAAGRAQNRRVAITYRSA